MIAQIWHTIRANYLPRDMIWFFRKRYGNSFSMTFYEWFSKKIFLMLYSVNWPYFIVWLPLLLEILGSMCMAIICVPGCDVINFEINFIFLIKLFFYKRFTLIYKGFLFNVLGHFNKKCVLATKMMRADRCFVGPSMMVPVMIKNVILIN